MYLLLSHNFIVGRYELAICAQGTISITFFLKKLFRTIMATLHISLDVDIRRLEICTELTHSSHFCIDLIWQAGSVRVHTRMRNRALLLHRFVDLT